MFMKEKNVILDIPTMITKSDKGELLESNYWNTELNHNGLFYLTSNASVGRLLVPDCEPHFLKEIKETQYIILCSGLYHSRQAMEIYFEDNTHTPLTLIITYEQIDRTFTDRDDQFFDFDIYTKSGKKAGFKAQHRFVGSLPALTT